MTKYHFILNAVLAFLFAQKNTTLAQGLSLDNAIRGFHKYEYVEKASKKPGDTNKMVALLNLPISPDSDAHQRIIGIGFSVGDNEKILAIKPIYSSFEIPDQNSLFEIVESGKGIRYIMESSGFETAGEVRQVCYIRKWAIACVILEKEENCFDTLTDSQLAALNRLFGQYKIKIEKGKDRKLNRIVLKSLATLDILSASKKPNR